MKMARYVGRSLLMVFLVCGFGICVLSQNTSPVGPKSDAPIKSTIPARPVTRPKPSKEALKQKWPPPAISDISASIDTIEADLRERFERAKSLMAAKKFEAALPILLDAANAAPKRFEIQMTLGVCLAQLNRLEEATLAFQKATNLDPKSAVAHGSLCQVMAESSKPFEAEGECREAIRLEPNRPRFRRLLADIYVDNELFLDAIQLIEGTAASRDDLASMGLLGDAYFLSGEYARAADIYEKIAATWPFVSLSQLRLSDVYDYLNRSVDSIAAARKFVELEPKLVISHVNLGEKLQSTGFFDESIEALKNAIQLDPNSGPAALILSENYSIIGDRESALPYLRIAYRQLPRTVPLATRLGRALLDNGSTAEAIEPLEFANKNAPNTPDIMRSLGLAYITMRRFDEGKVLVDTANQISPLPPGMTMTFFSSQEIAEKLARFDEVRDYLKENPKDLNARRFLISLYVLKEMPNEAEKQYFELIKLYPKDADIYNRLAVFYVDNGQHEKAIEAIRKAILLEPHHVFYSILSWELRKLGRLDEAIDAAAHSVEVKPDSVLMRLNYGELLLKRGRRNDALREYLAAFQMASGDKLPNFRLAWLYIRMGNKEGAFRHYGILKDIAPNELKWLELCLRAHFGTLP